MAQNGDRKAEITETRQVVATESEARAAAVDKLNSKTDKTEADLTTLRETVATDIEAISTQVTGLTSTVGENTAAIQVRGQTIFNKDGTGSSVYSMGAGITYKGKYYAAGLSIGAEVNAAGTVSTRILASADQFAVLNPATNGYTLPFFVQGSQTFIVSAMIQDASITNAKIGDYIQSSNYVAGKSGWRLNKSGLMEINSTTPGSGRMTFNGERQEVYDENNIRRVLIGKF